MKLKNYHQISNLYFVESAIVAFQCKGIFKHFSATIALNSCNYSMYTFDVILQVNFRGETVFAPTTLKFFRVQDLVVLEVNRSFERFFAKITDVWAALCSSSRLSTNWTAILEANVLR